jgi:hypothetical protein
VYSRDWLIDWWLTVFFVPYILQVRTSDEECVWQWYNRLLEFTVATLLDLGFGYNVGIGIFIIGFYTGELCVWAFVQVSEFGVFSICWLSQNSWVVTVTVSCCIDSTLAKICCFSGMLYSHFFDECDWVLVTRRQEAFGLNVFKPNCGRWVKAHV